jgi:hypothetical protein
MVRPRRAATADNVPLDIAQAGIRLTPGQIATEGIEALGREAKMLAEVSALVVVLVAGAPAGCVVRFGLQRNRSNILPLTAAMTALVAIAQMIGRTLPDVISLGAMAGLTLGWAAVLLAAVRRPSGSLRGTTPIRGPCPFAVRGLIGYDGHDRS